MRLMTPLQQLEGFIAKFDDGVAVIGRRAIKKMRARHPSANVLVYDNYSALAIGFTPGERTSEAIFSLYPKYASLFFLQSGAALKDPAKRLEGTGSQVRHMKLKSADDLDDKVVIALMDDALARAKASFASAGEGAIVIKSVSAKQRPRRAVR
jgi:hypothetical protein